MRLTINGWIWFKGCFYYIHTNLYMCQQKGIWKVRMCVKIYPHQVREKLRYKVLNRCFETHNMTIKHKIIEHRKINAIWWWEDFDSLLKRALVLTNCVSEPSGLPWQMVAVTCNADGVAFGSNAEQVYSGNAHSEMITPRLKTPV